MDIMDALQSIEDGISDLLGAYYALDLICGSMGSISNDTGLTACVDTLDIVNFYVKTKLDALDLSLQMARDAAKAVL